MITLVWCASDFKTEQVPLQYRGEVWFLLVLCTSCNVLFTTSLRDRSGGIYLCMNVSGDVCDEVVSRSSMYKPAAFLAELTSVQTYSWCRLCVLSGMQSVQAVFLWERCWTSMIWIQQDYYRGSPRATLWNWSVVAARLMVCGVGHNEALDRTMPAIGKILIDPANGKAISDIDGQSDRDDVASRVFLWEIDVSADPLLKTSYPQLESNFKHSDVKLCVKECAGGVRDRVLQRATRICRYFLCSSLFGAIEEIKPSLVAHGVPRGFLDLDCDSHSIGKNANTPWKSKTVIWKVQMGVCETKTFKSDTRSIIGLEPAKRAVEKYSSDLLAVSERNVELKRSSPAEIAGVARRLLVMELKQSVFSVLHEDLEQSFCAEIAIVEKHLKMVKEIIGNMRNSQNAERVGSSEKEESQVGKVGKVG